MSSNEQGTQLRVGVFVAIGLIAVGLMVVYFGRVGDGFRKYYELRVEYPNASGLMKGASVLLAGAKIGMVRTSPSILPDMDGVYVMLQIYEEVQIPSASEFTVGSSGLLGDRFVQIILKQDARSSPRIEPGTTIKGRSESGGIGDLTEQAGALMGDVQAAVRNINQIAEKLNEKVFQDSSIEDLNKTITNLRETSASFAASSQKIEGVLTQAETAVKTGEETLVSAKVAAEEFRKTMTDVRSLVQQAKSGRGVVGVLLSDREVAENIRALVANMRAYGILWYRDKPTQGR